MKRIGALRAAALSLFLVSGSSQLVAQECGGATAAADRQRCDDMFTRSIQTAGQTSQLPGGWRLAKIPDPRGGPQVVSVFHTADTGASDFNFAGLTFRCGGTGIETLLILLQPLPRRSQYVVRIKGGSVETQFEASTLQAG